MNANDKAFIVFITALYAYVTWCILNENKKTFLARFMPVITLEYDDKKNEFLAENIGTGLAINVEIDEFIIYVNDQELDLILKFDKLRNLKPNEKEKVIFKTFANDNPIDSRILTTHLSTFGSKDFVFDLAYKDMFSNKYYEKVNMGKSGIFILKQYKGLCKRIPNFLLGKIKNYGLFLFVKIKRRFAAKKLQ